MKDNSHNRKKSVHQQDLLGLLNAEYEKLRQLRLDQCNSLKSQWDNYQDQQRKNRKKEIQKRQIEFDKELEINDKERRKHWTIASRQDVDKETKRRLLLNNTQNHLNVDTSVLTIPIPLLELFWILDITPPVTLSDVQSTIDSIAKLKESDL
ncbi:hypothetical protein K501DRAFT_249387 [Backusella circina FSU 941]|nr:hypothetical protein K501DRAFT_249387 [Backusella circina FSU 941]